MELKRISSLVMASVMTLSLATPASAQEVEQEAKSTSEIVIVHTNDIHCMLENGHTIAGVAGYKALLQETHEYVTLVDAGDFIQGGPYGALSTGQFIIDAFNAANYDIVTIGNHEYDYQIPRMIELMDQLEAKKVSSNFVDLATGESFYDAYIMETYGDTNIAYVGIATPESLSKSTPSYFQDEDGEYVYSFMHEDNGPSLWANVQETIDLALEAGADYVIAIGHMGVEEGSAPWRSIDVIENTTGLDIFIDGHSHTVVDGQLYTDVAGEEVILVQAGEYLSHIGKITIDPVADTITTELLAASEVEVPQDETVRAFLDALNAELDLLLQEVVAHSEVELTTTHPETGDRIIRNMETNLGDLVADGYRVLTGADVALVNGGGIRASIPAGDITYEQVIAVHPFGNQATSIEVTGQVILDALEMSVKSFPGESGGFLQVSGLTYTLNPNIPSSVVVEADGAFVSVDGEYRVSEVVVGGEPLDLEATYVVASHDYMLLSFGDGMAMFNGATLVKDKFMIDNEVLINFIKTNLDGVVGEEYSNPFGQGRITVLDEISDEEVEVEDEEVELEDELTEETSAVEAFGIDADVWYYDAAEYVLTEGLMGSVSAEEADFAPSATVTRATVYQTLYNLAGKPAVEGEASFEDVAGTWYATSAAWAEQNGLTTGDGTGAYAGDRAVTRGEIATMMVRYAELSNLYVVAGNLLAFNDADLIADWAVEGVSLAVGSAIMSGKPGDVFAAADTATRVELATILLNMSDMAPAYTTETVELEVEDYTVSAVVTIPTTQTLVPAAVLLADAELEVSFEEVAATLAKAGYLSILVDYTAENAVEEARAALAYVSELEMVACWYTPVIGLGQGGVVALESGAAYPNYEAVVAWGAEEVSEELLASIEAPVLNLEMDEVEAMLAAAIEFLNETFAEEVEETTEEIDPNDMLMDDMMVELDETEEVVDMTVLMSAFTVSDVVVENDGREVIATVTLPTGEGPFAAVVMNHGHGGSRSENGGLDSIAEQMAMNGIASIRMDFPGCGESEVSFQENNLTNMVSDSMACANYLLENYDIDADALAVFGYSMGGRVALASVEADESLYSAVILLAGSTDNGEDAAKYIAAGELTFEEYYAQAEENGFASYPWFGTDLEISMSWYEDMFASYPLTESADYTGAMLIIYGEEDTVVSVDTNEATVAAFPQADVVVIPEADHGYGFYSEQPEVTNLLETSVVEFLAAQFAG